MQLRAIAKAVVGKEAKVKVPSPIPGGVKDLMARQV
jgi:hypothetical protein